MGPAHSWSKMTIHTAINLVVPIVVSDFANSVSLKFAYINIYKRARQYENALRARDLIHFYKPSDATRSEEKEQ